MAPRPAPPVSEIRDALASHGRAGLELRLSEDRAVPWELAIDVVRAAFRTTREKARGWLIEAVSDINGPLAAVWVTGTVKLASRNTEGGRQMIATPVAWPLEDQMALRFTKAGQRIPFGTRESAMRPHDSDSPWVVLRIALGGMHSMIMREMGEARRQRAEAENAKAAEFRNHYGAALDTITDFLGRMDQSGVDERWRDYEVFRTSLFPNGTRTRVFGGPGSLEISLHGKQIEAFAALIRETTGAE